MIYTMRWDSYPIHVEPRGWPLRKGCIHTLPEKPTIVFGWWAFIGVYDFMDDVDGWIDMIRPGGRYEVVDDRIPLFVIHKYGTDQPYEADRHVFLPTTLGFVYPPDSDILFYAGGGHGGKTMRAGDVHFQVALFCRGG